MGPGRTSVGRVPVTRGDTAASVSVTAQTSPLTTSTPPVKSKAL